MTHSLPAAARQAQEALQNARLHVAASDIDEDPEAARGIEASLAQIDAAIASLTAALSLPGGGIPEGWVLVPVEPTEEMLDALSEELGGRDTQQSDPARVAYRAMLAAAPLSASPTPPTGADGDGAGDTT